MIVSYSDTHGALADIAAKAEAEEQGLGRCVLIEAVSAVHHLCDQYGLDYQEVLAEAAGFYQHQRERDLKELESRGD